MTKQSKLIQNKVKSIKTKWSRQKQSKVDQNKVKSIKTKVD